MDWLKTGEQALNRGANSLGLVVRSNAVEHPKRELRSAVPRNRTS
jgi:hypothetical protein